MPKFRVSYVDSVLREAVVEAVSAEEAEVAVAATVAGLHEFRQNEARRIELYRTTDLSPDRANSLILQAYESGIIGARLLPDVIRQWRNPSHPEFQERTAWSLLNAFTEVLKDRQRQQPARAAHETITLQKLLDGTYGTAAQTA